ncbi:MAG: T9SS type A sorting domain-containing protein [Ignavibacteria bacterium]|nr:T9SS type A sorting domain-containing protein [Ignavibacteria bacterium]
MEKKLQLLIAVILFAVTLTNISLAGDRNILLERFTSSTCGPCATANPALDAFLSATDPNRLSSVSYHMNWPAPGNDPMYLANPTDNTSRRTQYGVNSIPYWFMDGTYINGVSQPVLQAAFDSRTNVLSPITIVVTETANGNNITVKADIYCEFGVSIPTAIVHFSVGEKLITYASPPGTNGERIFKNVFRKLFPSTGTPVTLLPGKKISLEFNYTLDPSWQLSQIENIVFVQGYANEIYNSGKPTTDFNLISAPAYKVVNLGQSQSADYKVKIPVIASGFNSAVTFTAALETPVAGITTEFPDGNVLSNFPDSLAFRVNSTAAVPAGIYKVIVTGTSASGKVHKTVMNYLVGKNYALFGANRSQASYKVDNVSYNTSRLFTWDIGSSHTVEAVSPITVGNTRYVFQNWSNGGPISQTINVGTQEINLFATYKIQYKLLGLVSPSGIPATVNGGNIFYDSAAVATISPDPMQVQFNGKTYFFQSWLGSGTGSYTGPNPTPSLSVNNIFVETAIYDTIDVGISNYSSVIPSKFELYQNYPNPFNPVTNIKFDIAKSSFTTLKVYNSLGKEVALLVNENLSPGSYQYSFDAGNYPSGIYYYKISTGSYNEIKKMILIK